VSEAEPPPRLDPDRAIEAARASAAGPELPPRREWKPEPPIDTRRYQWMIGGFGLLLVVLFSIYLYARGGSDTIGVPAGQPAHRFVAPLAKSNLDATANAHPRCNPARPAKRGLNVCWRKPTVLALFVTGHAPCVGEVDTLQRIAGSFPKIQFAAVAVNATRSSTARLVRRHDWRIPVAYDLTGVIGQVYGFSVCPLVELVRPGGIVAERLIGEKWEPPAVLAAAVRRSLGSAAGA
jgi:hypothetical protein